MKKIKTNYPGVRYREHVSRKHKNVFDRYFFIRYRADGLNKEEGLGWLSEGMTAARANEILGELKRANRTGDGAKTLFEKRKNQKDQKEAERQNEIKRKKEKITFEEVWVNYFDLASQNKKPKSIAAEYGLYSHWIEPVLGPLPLIEITPFHIEKIKRNLIVSGKSNRTVEYVLAVIRQVFNFANKYGISPAQSPTKKIKKLPINNKRTGYLSVEQAKSLLDSLENRSRITYEMVLLSLNCGLRAGEIFNLEWNDILLDRKIIIIKNGKGHKDRYVPMNSMVFQMLNTKLNEVNDLNGYVFINKKGQKIQYISKVFEKVIKELGFNDSVKDSKQKIVFHSLRHTFASWIAEKGGDLYVISKLLGHSSILMTQRYSHLSGDHMKKHAELIAKNLDSDDFEKQKRIFQFTPTE